LENNQRFVQKGNFIKQEKELKAKIEDLQEKLKTHKSKEIEQNLLIKELRQ
jgi:hypothetical protein